MRKRAKRGQSIFQCTPLFQTLTFVLLYVGFVCSQALECFIKKNDWIKSRAHLEGKQLCLLPGRVEVVLV